MLKDMLPWRLKLLSKVVLSRLPLSKRFWQSLWLFKHGAMESPDYALETFDRHWNRVKDRFADRKPDVLEMGPGDALITGLIGYGAGFGSTVLLDVAPFAHDDPERYRAMAAALRQRGREVPDLSAAASIQDVLSACNATYLTDGMASLRAIPDASVDFIFSQAVLEHVRLEEFEETMRQTRRILRPGGVCSHRIDLRDHLANALNSLRFKESTWEADWMRRSGFYTNRIRHDEMVAIFRRAGFRVEEVYADRWETLPTPRTALDPKYRDLSDENLGVWGFDVLLYPEAEGGSSASSTSSDADADGSSPVFTEGEAGGSA